jgi:hypothetical protein
VGGSFIGSSHTIEVVLANVEHWQFPESSHVSSFIDLTLIGSTITIHSNSNIGFILILECECKTSAYWELSTDDTITTIEVVLRVVVMHGTTFTL